MGLPPDRGEAVTPGHKGRALSLAAAPEEGHIVQGRCSPGRQEGHLTQGWKAEQEGGRRGLTARARRGRDTGTAVAAADPGPPASHHVPSRPRVLPSVALHTPSSETGSGLTAPGPYVQGSRRFTQRPHSHKHPPPSRAPRPGCCPVHRSGPQQGLRTVC